MSLFCMFCTCMPAARAIAMLCPATRLVAALSVCQCSAGFCVCCLAAAYSSYASDQAYHSKPKKHKPSSTWYDSDLAQAAAASQLHPDEFHNLFFGSDSSSSSKGTSRRQARKQAQKRAKQLRKQAQAMGVSGHGFAYAEAGAGEGRWHAAYDSDDDSYNSYSDSEEDDEYLGGTYRYYSPGQGRSHRQARQWEWQREQPDWQWWTAEQER